MPVSWPGTQRWASPGPACDNQAAASSLRNVAGPRCPDPTAQRASGDLGLGLISSSSSGPGPGRAHGCSAWMAKPGLAGLCVHLPRLISGACSPLNSGWMVQGRGLAEASQSARSLRPRGGPDQEEDRVGQGSLGQRAPSLQGCSGACEWRSQARAGGRSDCSQRPGLCLIGAGMGAGSRWVTLAWSQP